MFTTAPAEAAEPIAGRAVVVDADTLAVEGTKARICLYGMDAPESKQTCDDAAGERFLCGSRAAAHRAGLIGRNGRVRCFEEDRDRYGRIVAECATADGKTVLAATENPPAEVHNALTLSAQRRDRSATECKGDPMQSLKRSPSLGIFVGTLVGMVIVTAPLAVIAFA